MRHMYDAIAANAHTLVGKLGPDDLLAIYLTGSSAIRWTPTQVALFPAQKGWVRIDQGGQTSPQFHANVIDVEPGAWSVSNAQNNLHNFQVPRPTIYCDRSDFKSVTANCDIWLAAPGLTDDQAIALAKTDKRIVAVQNVWANTYDRSIVVDDNWPNAKVTPPPPAPTGLPTNIVFSAFATKAQINAKCDPVEFKDSEHKLFEWQLELLKVTGWELEQQLTTTGPLVSFPNLEPKQHYRFRVTRGTWSDWVNVNT